MIFGPDILAGPAAALILASTQMSCKVTEAPAITMKVITDDIHYDYTRSAADLTRVQTDTINPFPKGSDSVTGGLREDHPTILSEMQWSVRYSDRGPACMFFKTIDVTIHLKPTIYLAREFNQGQCRDAVLGHERQHIKVDREVMNKYAAIVGAGLQHTVNSVGALGPFDIKNKDAVKAQASGYVKKTLDVYEKQMAAELRQRQQAVDNIDEYKRIGTFCREIKVKK